MSTATDSFDIEITKTSRINEVDFENLSFGEIFADHMLVCDFKNGAWERPQIKPYQNISISPSASVLHYGQAIFEGMKAFKDHHGDAWLFRPEENFKRFNKSCERLAMPAITKEYFMEGLHKLLALDQNWIKSGAGNSLYIRPFMIASQAGIIASPAKEYKFMVICSPAQSYYSGEVRVKIAETFSRAASGGFGYAKAAGNYAGSFYPTQLAQAEGFQQVVWTDANTHQNIEEAGTMNIFIRIGNILITGPTSDSILDGITRKSLIQLAKDNGINLEVRPIKVAEILEAHKNNQLLEMFGAGTAAVVSPISGFGYKGEKYEITPQEDSYATFFKKTLNDIQYNLSPDPYGWRVKAY